MKSFRELGIEKLKKDWLKAKQKVDHLEELLRQLETSEETVSRQVQAWPDWKKNVKIGGQ